MPVQQPLVSICIPAYNCENFIIETIESVLNQTYNNIEIIIVNDGSTDSTKAVLANITSTNIRVYHQENAGASTARNLAYSKTTGQYIKFLDGDDIISPAMIESQVKLATANPGCIVSAQWGRFYNNDMNTFSLSTEKCWQTLSACDWLCTSWKNGQSMTQPGIFLLPKSVIENAGLWDEQLSLIDDLDFFTRAILKSKLVVFDAASTLYYRSGISGSLSDQKQDLAMRSAFRAIDKATANLTAVCTTPAAKLAAANTWQNFIYTIYPKHKDLGLAAEKKVNALGGASLPFVAGGFTKVMARIFGWKFTKRLKQVL